MKEKKICFTVKEDDIFCRRYYDAIFHYTCKNDRITHLIFILDYLCVWERKEEILFVIFT